MSDEYKVLIVGGGIAGQALAISLARGGIACEIVEIKPDFEILGAGTALLGPAMRALEEIGVADEVRSAGWSHEDVKFRYRDAHGDVVVETAVEGSGSGMPVGISIMRHALHVVLAEKVAEAGVPIKMGATVETANNGPDSIDVTFTDGTSASYDLLVGADGSRSKIRALLFGGEEPKFSGFSAWRYVMPRPESINDLNWFWGGKATIGIVPLSATEMYLAGTSIEPGNPRYAKEDLPQLFRDRFTLFEAEIPELLAQATDPDKMVYTPLEEVRMEGPWYDGRVILVGDAAHYSTPFWAFGAALALEDVALLARLLKEDRDPFKTLPAWFERRLPRCAFVQNGSIETGKQMHDYDGEIPRVFPPAAREALQNAMEKRSARLAEPY